MNVSLEAMALQREREIELVILQAAADGLTPAERNQLQIEQSSKRLKEAVTLDMIDVKECRGNAMTDDFADRDRRPSHPGELLVEIVPATGKSKSEIAGLLGISRQQLYDIMRQKKPVSANTAVRLGKLFGNGAGLWLRMQAAYDVWNALREVDLSGIPTLPSP